MFASVSRTLEYKGHKPRKASMLAYLALGAAALALTGNEPAFAQAVNLSTAFDSSRSEHSEPDLGGLVYAMINSSAGNEIRVYFRGRDGGLRELPGAAVSTGGAGGSISAPIDPLGSQSSLLHDAGLDMLFAVNAGDNTVTAFDTRFGLRPHRSAVVSSGGFIPVSLAVSEGMLYVLNAGGSGSVSTFSIEGRGKLEQIASFDLGLSNGNTLPFDQIRAPGQVSVDALGRRLLVTNAGGQELLSAALDDQGVPVGSVISSPTPGILPFALDVSRFGSVLVAEAASGSVTAFDPPSGTLPLTVSSGAVSTGQGASCWIVVHDKGYVYVSNTASDTISLLHVTRTGRLELVSPVAATTGGAPTDITLAGGGRFLYSLDAGSGQISGFAIDSDTGALSHADTLGGLPASAGIQGIASRDF